MAECLAPEQYTTIAKVVNTLVEAGERVDETKPNSMQAHYLWGLLHEIGKDGLRLGIERGRLSVQHEIRALLGVESQL